MLYQSFNLSLTKSSIGPLGAGRPAGGRRRERCQGARTRATHVTPRCRKHAPLSFRCPVIMSREAGGVPGGPQTTPSSGTVGLGNGACRPVVGSKGSRRATSGCPTANLSRKGCPPGGASAVREARRPRVSVGLRSKGTQGQTNKQTNSGTASRPHVSPTVPPTLPVARMPQSRRPPLCRRRRPTALERETLEAWS